MENDRLAARLLTTWLIILPFLPLNLWFSTTMPREVLMSPWWFVKLPLILTVGVILYRMGRGRPGQTRRVRLFWGTWVVSLLCNGVAYWALVNYEIWGMYAFLFDARVVHVAFIVLAILMYRAATKPVD